MIQLHHDNGSAAMAPHILLTEIGTPFELVPVDIASGAHKQPAYLALNPNGVVPTLVDGELVLCESAAICLHLAERFPEAGLLPPLGSTERALHHQWLMWLTNTLQATLISFFYPQRWVADGHTEGAAEVKARAEARVGAMLDLLAAQLARSPGPWLLGAHYRAVDAYALMLTRWTRHFGAVDRPARERPAIAAWQQRVLARPAVQRVFEREGLAQPWV